MEVDLQHDDVQLVEGFIQVLGLEGIKGANVRGDLRLGMSWGISSGWL